ncbi:DUF368 domain-containing protein [Halopseudomonas xinjiangensis]|nr:DUF368 domain-containing protein [Halopseudomonas xinjiangensis]
MAMGAADIVPGVSGGTIAFISGIYDRLIDAIAACTPDKLLWLTRGRVRETWQAVDGGFLLTLLAGILTSVFSLARLISYLLDNHPEPLWSFFFGLIVASVLLVGREIQRWNAASIAAFVVGTAFAYLVTVAVPIQLPVTMVTLFFGAAVAICAMILPGISGSFILLLLGLYAGVLEAVRNLDFALLGVFMLGCIGGLLSFARLLSWLLDYARNITLAFLAGLLLGSLNKVWPWKETVTWRQDSHGEMAPLIQSNVGPIQYEQLTGEPSHWLLGLALMALGVVLVMALERWGRRT